MANKGNKKKGDFLLQIAVGVLASNWTLLPLKAQTVPLFPVDFTAQTPIETQTPSLSEPLAPQTAPSEPNLPQPEPSPSLQQGETEPNSDTSEVYECPIARSVEPQSPTTQTPEDNKTNEVIEAISVTNFRFIGNTVFSQKTLEQEIIKKILKLDSNTNRITFAQLQQIISEVTKFYNEKGYINSFAYLPTTSEEPNQRLQNRGAAGEVIIKIVEGGLESIRVRRRTGKQRLNFNYICSRLAIASQPLQTSRLLDALRLLQLDPLIKSISAELIPGSQLYRSALEVKFEEGKTFSAALLLDNRRAPSIGSFRRQLQLTEANLLGKGDGLSLAYTNTDGSNAFDLSYTLPLNPNNGTINLSAGVTANRVIEEPFEKVDIRAAAQYFDLTLRQPILRNPRQELAVGVTATRRESGTSILGEDFPLSAGADAKGRTGISAIRFFQDWTVRNNDELLALRSQFSLGLGAFNATVNSEAPDSRFLAWRGQGQWIRRLKRDTFVLAKTDIQLANRTLLPLEQFGIGGGNSVRGYRQDILLADNGISASAELRFPIFGRSDRGLGVLQITPFVDAGTVWNSSGRDSLERQLLLSVGTGLRWELGDSMSANFYWGIPLVDVNSRGTTWQEKGLHFSVLSRFSF
ncbi:ShlB/FhaC/HecB family hemolysin secretion/activation protein [Tychonema sp. LEGE 07199]|uniref:ShlB/FhaC/HecB family hemolysin secretion/activation protein n=1 Tax=unclassified Tychonema TaxID=2642144 RepID=UPI001880C663|nr:MULTISPECIES: ShlB/FhaC/HecB family hemolysin secretion/activation protein [unclassified Tychonema]MBE9119499.1 ShlB/FhaC/HecB family hemolysin secretion/activation protein [Tychonema sp. LEGE 07199]MBE9130729.1 ShlB/FhaC/HecB family hemolysin secretion/activation protein [Tychonema sp. LEGE 07196]